MDWSESAVGIFLENSSVNKTTLYYCCFYRLFALKQGLVTLNAIQSLAKLKKHLGQTTNEMLIENTHLGDWTLGYTPT